MGKAFICTSSRNRDQSPDISLLLPVSLASLQEV